MAPALYRQGQILRKQGSPLLAMAFLLRGRYVFGIIVPRTFSAERPYMPQDRFDPFVDALVAHLHQRDRLRVWSIVISIFGDAILPRGGRVWLGSLLEICARLGIEAGSVRAAMSRLAQDGWIMREKQGRKSFYRLAETGKVASEAASHRIYAPVDSDWGGQWSILMISDQAGEGRDARRAQLRAAGFGAVAPTIFIRPDMAGNKAPQVAPKGDFLFTAQLADFSDPHGLGQQAWDTDTLEAEYRAFDQLYTPMLQAFEGGAMLAPLEAMALRTMLIHDFRRLVLRDPMLPAQISGPQWLGNTVRHMVAKFYHLLLKDSENWLDSQMADYDAGLKNCDNSIAKRFCV